MKGSDNTIINVQTHTTPLPVVSRAPARKRPSLTPSATSNAVQASTNNKDDRMVETPKRRPPPKQEVRDISK